MLVSKSFLSSVRFIISGAEYADPEDGDFAFGAISDAEEFRGKHKETLYAIRTTYMWLGLQQDIHLDLSLCTTLAELKEGIFKWLLEVTKQGIKALISRRIIIVDGKAIPIEEDLTEEDLTNLLTVQLPALHNIRLFANTNSPEAMVSTYNVTGIGTFLVYFLSILNLFKENSTSTIQQRKSSILNEFKRGGAAFAMMGWGFKGIIGVEDDFIDSETYTFKDAIYFENERVRINHDLVHKHVKAQAYTKRKICPAGEDYTGQDQIITEIVRRILNAIPERFLAKLSIVPFAAEA